MYSSTFVLDPILKPGNTLFLSIGLKRRPCKTLPPAFPNIAGMKSAILGLLPEIVIKALLSSPVVNHDQGYMYLNFYRISAATEAAAILKRSKLLQEKYLNLKFCNYQAPIRLFDSPAEDRLKKTTQKGSDSCGSAEARTSAIPSFCKKKSYNKRRGRRECCRLFYRLVWLRFSVFFKLNFYICYLFLFLSHYFL